MKRRWKRTEILKLCDGYEMLPCVNGEQITCVSACVKSVMYLYIVLLRFLRETLVNGTKEGAISVVSMGWDDGIALYMHLYQGHQILYIYISAVM